MPSSLPILSLPLTLLISALPHWYTIYLAESSKTLGGWTNQNPRAFVARLNARAASGKALSAVEEKILRGQSAQQNGYEWWGVWGAAVILGTMAKIPQAEMERWTYIHLVSRALYSWLYIVTGTRRSSYLRTIVFQISLFPAVAIFLKAAKVFGEAEV